MERVVKQNGESATPHRTAQAKFTSKSRENELASSPMMAAQRKQLQSLFGGAAQLKGKEEEPLQGKFEAVQRAPEEEPLQGKFTPVQRVKEEEPLQGKFAPNSSAQLKEEPAPKPNNTGLPDNLKNGIETLSGMSMDNVKVHYNSSQPAQLNALAYAQGTNIHVAPGQEQHLPHEAWHVVQQAQGRVKPTMQMKDGVPVNDDKGLEHEADVMGGRAVQMKVKKKPGLSSVLQKCIGVEAGGDWQTVSSFDHGIRLDKTEEGKKEGAGGALTVFLTGSAPFYHRIVSLEWYDGYERTGKEMVAHLATPDLSIPGMSSLKKVGKQLGSLLPGKVVPVMRSRVEALPFRQDSAGKTHRTVRITEDRKEEVRNTINHELDREYDYGLWSFSCKDWAQQVAPEAII